MSPLKNAKQERPEEFANHRHSEALTNNIPMAKLIIGLAVLLTSSSGAALAEAQNRTGAALGCDATLTSVEPLRIVYFHSPSCHECQGVKNFLPQITSRWGDHISLEMRSVDDVNVFDELFKHEKHYSATVASPPAIFVADNLCTDYM